MVMLALFKLCLAFHGVAGEGKSFEAGFICNHYASPNEPGTCPDTVGQCPGEATCQPNGCFNGDYCHLTTGHCVLKSSVSCDGGL